MMNYAWDKINLELSKYRNLLEHAKANNNLAEQVIIHSAISSLAEDIFNRGGGKSSTFLLKSLVVYSRPNFFRVAG